MAKTLQPRVKMGVDFKGPLFRVDATKKYGENVEGVLKELAAFGERDVKARIGTIGTGRTRDRIVGRVHSVQGKPWHRHVVVSPSIAGLDRKEAISLMAAASSIEARYHPFRKAASDMRRFRISVADLIKGLN